MSIAMQLAAAGWWGGNPEKILQAPVDIVLAAWHYHGFRADFEAAYMELNREIG